MEEDLIELEGIPARRLEELKLIRSQHSLTKMNLFGGKAERLQHIELRGFSVPWDSAMLSGLRTLILSDLGSAAPSEEEIIGILRASPALVQLSLGGFACERSISSTQTSPIELPVLTSFTLLGINISTAFQLLSLIRLPECAAFRVKLELASPTDLFSGDSMVHLVPSIRKIMATHPIVRVEIRPLGIFISCGDAENLEICITEGTVASDLAARLVHLIDTPELVLELFITPQSDDIPLTAILPILTSRCIIKDLILEDLGGHLVSTPEAVIKFLTEPLFKGKTAGWPLPDLEFLKFQGSSTNWDLLLQMINRRYGQTDACSKLQERPARLHTLDLSTAGDVEAPYDRQLIEILGAGVIRWLEGVNSGSESEMESTDDTTEDSYPDNSSGSGGSHVSATDLMGA